MSSKIYCQSCDFINIIGGGFNTLYAIGFSFDPQKQTPDWSWILPPDVVDLFQGKNEVNFYLVPDPVQWDTYIRAFVHLQDGTLIEL